MKGAKMRLRQNDIASTATLEWSAAEVVSSSSTPWATFRAVHLPKACGKTNGSFRLRNPRERRTDLS